jgi:hypothetical protein
MPFKKNKFILGILFIYSIFLSCKVSETKIQNIEPINTLWINNLDSARVLCSTYYLKHFDTTHKTRKSKFKSDLDFAKIMVFESLKELYATDSLVLKKFILYTDPAQIKSETYIDIQIHVFINWWSMVPMAKVRESVYVKSSIITNGMVVKSHGEWGFRKTLGEFYDQPDAYWECDLNAHNLKLYCIKKSLNELIKN